MCFRRVADRAGLKGSFKKIRKASASNVELRFPGCGSAHLGHVSQATLAQTNYLDPRIVGKNKPLPEPILPTAEGSAV